MWETALVTMLRSIIGDMDSAVYTDARLQQVLVVGAYHVSFSDTFLYDYQINLSVPDISPDPVEVNDKDFSVLTVYKAACIIVSAESKTKNANGLSMRDGPSFIDTTAGSVGLANNAKSICQEYQDLLLQYGISGPNNSAGPGQAILGPYSPGSDLVNWTMNSHRDNGWQ